jgi:hypothetical protein
MSKLRRKNKFIILLICNLTFVSLSTFGGDVPIDRDFLRLPDQRWVWLEKTGWHSTRITLGKGEQSFKNKIWSKTYQTGRDEKRHSWAYTFFIRVKPNQFIDFDVDKNPLVATSTYDMGNGVIRWAIIWRVKRDHLEIANEIDGYNVAADESVFH